MKDLKKDGSFNKKLVHSASTRFLASNLYVFLTEISRQHQRFLGLRKVETDHWWPGISLAKPDSS